MAVKRTAIIVKPVDDLTTQILIFGHVVATIIDETLENGNHVFNVCGSDGEVRTAFISLRTARGWATGQNKYLFPPPWIQKLRKGVL